MDRSGLDVPVCLALLIWILMPVTEGGRNLACEFPVSWRGHWHQASLGQIYVTDDAISKKGTCIENFGDYFLLQNTETGCVSCLLMLRRHDNIIQYKESHCILPDNLHSVCQLIRPEADMYTLVREPTQTITCPFPDNYRVTYDSGYHGSLGSCDTSNSYLNACGAGDKSMRFHFEHCSPSAVWNGQDLRFECLATWKEGSEDFLYGRFSGTAIARKDDSYRCFKYDARGVAIQLSMSADATCRGLVSAVAGPVVMLLERDVTNQPESSCTYPSWLTSSRWQDYSGDVTVAFHGHRHKLSVQSSESHDRLLCSDLRALGADEYVVAAYLAENCGAKFQCLRFKRLNDRAFTLVRGDVTDDHVDAYHCSARRPQASDVTTKFISSRAIGDPLACPSPGVYSYVDETQRCDMHVYAGCSSGAAILVKPQCQAIPEMSLQCITYWTEEGSTYWVVRSDGDDKLYCIVLNEISAQNFSMSTCGQPGGRPQFRSVNVRKHGSCNYKIPTRPVISDSTTSISATRTPTPHRRHPPDKSLPTQGTATSQNRVPYRVPSTPVNTQRTVTPPSGRNVNSNDETQTSKQYSSPGASNQYINYSRTSFIVLLSFISLINNSAWL